MFAAPGLITHPATLLVMTAIVAGLMVLSARRLNTPWPALALFALPCLALLLDTDILYGTWHANLHASVVNSIIQSGIPPENPLLAGEPLRYPYGQHILVAALSAGLGIPAAWVFWALTLLSLPLVMFLLDRIACLYDDDTTFRLLGVLCGLTLLFAAGYGPLQNLLRELWVQHLGFRNEFRFLPFVKFTTQNGSPVGFVMFLMTFLGVSRLLIGRGGRLGATLLAASGVVGAGLLYPFAWLMAGLAVGLGVLTGLWMHWRSPTSMERRVLILLLGIGLLGLTPLPYLLDASSGKSGDAALLVLPWLSYPLQQASNLALVLALPILLTLLNPGPVRSMLGRQRAVSALLLMTATGGLFAYVLLAAPDRVEYKIASLAFLILGLVLAAALAPWARTRVALFWLLTALCVHPMLNRVASQMHYQYVDRTVRVDGRPMARDPGEAELLTWARDHTPSDAVFVDRHRTLPPIAGRPLYVGFNPRQERPTQFQRSPKPHDGWGMASDMFLSRVSGAPATLIAGRRSAARTLWQSDHPGDRLKALRYIQAEMSPRPVYVVARTEEARKRLDATPGVKAEFSNETASAYRLEPDRH
ncbi:MAG: hypothetical protein ACPGUC_04295 [Gammaproteobacteria bacterium]